MDIGKLIGKLIKVGMVLGTLGVLAKITVALKDETVDTQRHGMVSLGGFNRRLEKRR